MNPILEVKNLNFSYGKQKPVLNNISFTVKSGEIVGILGKNGSGKSTLLNIIAGFLKKYDGEIFVAGENIKSLTLKKRAQILSYIQQKSNSIPNYYTVKDFILEGRRAFCTLGFYKKNDYELLENVLTELQLLNSKEKLVKNMSGGEIQRCIFARATIKGAKLLLLDEPCSAMDIKNQKDFFESVKQSSKNKNSGFLITIHDINLATQNCDKILILNEGKLIYAGDSKEVPKEALSSAFGVEVTHRPTPNFWFY